MDDAVAMIEEWENSRETVAAEQLGESNVQANKSGRSGRKAQTVRFA
jgi:hypothetical protein